jgi:hypothetical protein
VARPPQRARSAGARRSAPALRAAGQSTVSNGRPHTASYRQQQAWQWALANRAAGGALPSGQEIARAHGRKERWGRLVKSAGQAGAFSQADAQGPPPITDSGREVPR